MIAGEVVIHFCDIIMLGGRRYGGAQIT
jgi:hypothetical protein